MLVFIKHANNEQDFAAAAKSTVVPKETEIQALIYEQDQEPIEYIPFDLPTFATDNPADFLDYLDSIDIVEAKKIELSDSFVLKLIEYQDEYFDELYKDQEEPSPMVQDILSFMENSVGGNYLFSAQGTPVTREFVEQIAETHPDYMDGGRTEYFFDIADNLGLGGRLKKPVYPYEYAWDCSGLWWDCVNTLKLFDEYTDRTAQQTYDDYCISIEKDELRPGDLVFYRNVEGRISHVAIVGEKGYVYEAASGFVGVVKQRSLNVRIYKDLVRGGYLVFPIWTEYGRPLIYE